MAASVEERAVDISARLPTACDIVDNGIGISEACPRGIVIFDTEDIGGRDGGYFGICHLYSVNTQLYFSVAGHAYFTGYGVDHDAG